MCGHTYECLLTEEGGGLYTFVVWKGNPCYFYLLNSHKQEEWLNVNKNVYLNAFKETCVWYPTIKNNL